LGSSDISWTICKSSAPRSRQITRPAHHHSKFLKADALPDAQPTVSKHELKAVHTEIQLNKKAESSIELKADLVSVDSRLAPVEQDLFDGRGTALYGDALRPEVALCR